MSLMQQFHMPAAGQPEENLGGDQAVEENRDKGGGIWTRKRLVRTPSGHWVRIGRLSRVHYRD